MPSYYRMANHAYVKLYGEPLMLHWPMAGENDAGILDCHKNLTDFCISRLPGVRDRRVLDVGCGNGVQTLYVKEKYQPAMITGVDIDDGNIAVAHGETESREIEGVEFFLGDAQDITCVDDESIDCVTNIESAFHYPDKHRFLGEVTRVLESGGGFVISDICNRMENGQTGAWLRFLKHYHWTREDYVQAFDAAGLTLVTVDNLTDKILHGLSQSISWLRSFRAEDGRSRRIVRYWGILLYGLEKKLLNSHREYLVFSGKKR